MSDPSFDTVAQSAHAWFGGWLVYTFALWTSPWWAVVAIAIFGAVKEYWYDEKYESPTVRGNATRDMVFYLLGSSLTASLLTIVR
jgi:hypothetical protein